MQYEINLGIVLLHKKYVKANCRKHSFSQRVVDAWNGLVDDVVGACNNISKDRGNRWLGHVLHMDHKRIPQQALYRQVPGFKRGPGRPRANWRSTVNKDLLKMGFTWEEAEEAALGRHGWHRSVAQCDQLDAK